MAVDLRVASVIGVGAFVAQLICTAVAFLCQWVDCGFRLFEVSFGLIYFVIDRYSFNLHDEGEMLARVSDNYSGILDSNVATMILLIMSIACGLIAVGLLLQASRTHNMKQCKGSAIALSVDFVFGLLALAIQVFGVQGTLQELGFGEIFGKLKLPSTVKFTLNAFASCRDQEWMIGTWSVIIQLLLVLVAAFFIGFIVEPSPGMARQVEVRREYQMRNMAPGMAANFQGPPQHQYPLTAQHSHQYSQGGYHVSSRPANLQYSHHAQYTGTMPSYPQHAGWQPQYQMRGR
eukprot:TRINITY_DN48518_c0_g1_i1.p1 TRINITY_DN48518_c0_g1~~TRINITY_DN48518_c0_g1_i1.p1  ORF type:complete len:290 (+),score=23.32 TRINITY_DN48518_c0_g1_i1:133-1002(+)